MTLKWIIFGTLAQLMLGFFLFMVVVFSASGIGNTGKLGRIEWSILNLSMFALPATCAVSALIVVYLYWAAAARHLTGGTDFRWRLRPCI